MYELEVLPNVNENIPTIVEPINFDEIKNELKKKIKKTIQIEISSKALEKIYLKLVDEIFKGINDDNIKIINQEKKQIKLHLKYELWVSITDKAFVKKNGIALHNLTKFFRKKKFITHDSKLYPQNQVLLSINPLSKAFLTTSNVILDDVLDMQDEMINILSSQDTLTLEKEILLFIYFRLFTHTNIPTKYFKYFTYENIFHLNDQILLVVKLEDEKIEKEDENRQKREFIPIKPILFSRDESKYLKNVFSNKIESLLDYNNYLFSEEFEYYEKELKKYCLQKNLSSKKIKLAIELDYQLNSTPLDLTIAKYTNHPKLSLFEVEKLFPGVISNNLLEIEKSNLEFYRQSPSNVDDIEKDLDEHLASDYEIYEKFKTIKNVPKSRYVTKGYLKKWYEFLKRYKSHKIYGSMCIYAKKLLNLADREFNAKPILSKTLQAYLQRIFDYCFNLIVRSNSFEEALLKIDEKLNSIEKPEVYTKYSNDVYKYLTNEYGVTNSKINNVINYNRSIIFKSELDNLVQRLNYRDMRDYKCEILQKSRQVFVILAYYSGLRKTELHTRMIKDIYHTEENKFVIDVNNSGYRKDSLKTRLKNANAKRRVEFEIEDKKFAKLVKEYLDLMEENNYRFLFPSINVSTKKAAKKKVMKVSNIDEINELLQKITKRYTVVHSFRHTYVTRELTKILNSKEKSIDDVFDLMIRVGHGDFETTLSRYFHKEMTYFNI